jgi:hypothetical protein
MLLHKEDVIHSHRPPLPNPQPDPGPLPDPAPIPSPEPSPIPEPLPPPFGAHETRAEVVSDRADVKPGEIEEEDRIHFGTGQDAPEWPTLVRIRVSSRLNQRGVTGGMRLGLILVIALTLCAACEPRKPPPMVSYGEHSPMLSYGKQSEGGLQWKFEKS